MSKKNLSLGLVTLAVVASLGYQSLSDNDSVTVSNSMPGSEANAEPSNEHQIDKPVIPAAELIVSVSPTSEMTNIAVATPTSKDETLAYATPQQTPSSDSEMQADMNHQPSQISAAMRAPGSGPRAGKDYAHHPRPGTQEPIKAPVSRPAPAPTPGT
jgi:hypothetical protein